MTKELRIVYIYIYYISILSATIVQKSPPILSATIIPNSPPDQINLENHDGTAATNTNAQVLGLSQNQSTAGENTNGHFQNQDDTQFLDNF